MIAWVALALALVALLLWLVVAVTLRRVWRVAEPQVRPLLAMFAPAESLGTDPTALLRSTELELEPERELRSPDETGYGL